MSFLPVQPQCRKKNGWFNSLVVSASLTSDCCRFGSWDRGLGYLAEIKKDESARRSFGWGIIGTGRIALDFATDLAQLSDARVTAVLSRDQSSANVFATKSGAQKVYCDVDQFMADEDVNIVYVASPNSMHFSQALRAIRAGKAVLIEKPVALSEAEAEALHHEALNNDVFVMEAMWIRFLPGILAIKSMIEAGSIGVIQSVSGTLSWKNNYDPQSRLFNKALGGGASLDLGVYLLSLTLHLLGEPETISGSWQAALGGVDMRASYRLQYPNAVASLECGLDRTLANTFEIKGSKGTFRISDPFVRARRVEIGTSRLARWAMSLSKNGTAAKVLARLPFPGHKIIQFPYEGHGLSFQAQAVMDALRRGETGHAIMPISESAAVLRAISLVMAQPPSA